MRDSLSTLWRYVNLALRRRLAIAGAVLILITVVGVGHFSAKADTSATNRAGSSPSAAPQAPEEGVVNLSDAQLQLVKIGAAEQRSFPLERTAVGSVDFDEDMAALVFPPYQGRITSLFVKVGENVKRGQPLLTIESPDLIQADSTLISAAAVLDLTTHVLERARQLYQVEGMAEKDLQQAVSDQQTAEGSLKAARDAVAVFGKSAAEIERIVKTRTIDPYLVVPSPITGRVTARNAAPGDFVQPGNLPAPYSVADISRMWVNASVTESDMPLVHKGQAVRMTVMARPGRVLEGQITLVGATVDGQLHRGLVRVEITDARHELLPGMFASFVIVTGSPVIAVALPEEGIVREGDGSMTAWFTADRHRFTRRPVKIGLQHDGYDQIIDGVQAGEQVVTKGAVFLANLANGGDS